MNPMRDYSYVHYIHCDMAIGAFSLLYVVRAVCVVRISGLPFFAVDCGADACVSPV